GWEALRERPRRGRCSGGGDLWAPRPRPAEAAPARRALRGRARYRVLPDGGVARAVRTRRPAAGPGRRGPSFRGVQRRSGGLGDVLRAGEMRPGGGTVTAS